MSAPEPSEGAAESRTNPTGLSARLSVAVFAIVEAVALVIWLVVGRFQWFYNDDWDFIAGRKVRDLGDLFHPHNEHWVTVPLLVYKLLFFMFGLRTFFPYRVVIVLVHLAAAALLFVVLRRAGVHPWISTAAGSCFALFGSGSQDILLPFQIAFTGALAMGLTQLILSDHDGPIDRRDRLGLVAGFIGLMCSGIAVSMTVIVGIAVLLRRGKRAAAFHTLPLAAAYVVWFAATGHTGYLSSSPTPGTVVAFVAKGFRFALRAIVKTPAFIHNPLLIVIALVVVVGIVFAVKERRTAGRTRELAVPAALLAGAVVFLAITGSGRQGFGTAYSGTNRYVYLVAAMTIPTIAIALDALVRRWRLILPVAVALFVVGIPANIHAASISQRSLKPIYAETKRMILSLPHAALARVVPRSLRPEQAHASWITIGWLLDGVKNGHIPEPARTAFVTLAQDNFRLSFEQVSGPTPTQRCHTLTKPLNATLKRGDVIEFSKNTIQITPTHRIFGIDPPLLFFPADGTRLVVLANAGSVRFDPVSIGWNWRVRRENTHTPAVVCTPR